jgi:hypothetical protein
LFRFFPGIIYAKAESLGIQLTLIGLDKCIWPFASDEVRGVLALWKGHTLPGDECTALNVTSRRLSRQTASERR